MSCSWCGNEIISFKDELSEKEFKISGMCQECQDKTFVEDERPGNCPHCGLSMDEHDGSGFCPAGSEEFGGRR